MFLYQISPAILFPLPPFSETDEESSLGLEELMAELYLLKSIQDKVCDGTTAAIPLSHSLPLPLMQAGTHSHVVSLIAVTGKRDPSCLLLDYMPHGTLDNFLWSLKKGPVPDW